jgi:GTP-binding protein
LRNLRREVGLYDPTLSKRPWYVIANKIDLPGASENLEALRNQFRTIDVTGISAKIGEGIEALKRKLQIWVGETVPSVDQDR